MKEKVAKSQSPGNSPHPPKKAFGSSYGYAENAKTNPGGKAGGGGGKKK